MNKKEQKSDKKSKILARKYKSLKFTNCTQNRTSKIRLLLSINVLFLNKNDFSGFDQPYEVVVPSGFLFFPPIWWCFQFCMSSPAFVMLSDDSCDEVLHHQETFSLQSQFFAFTVFGVMHALRMFVNLLY